MNRREFLAGVPPSVLAATSHGWADLLPGQPHGISPVTMFAAKESWDGFPPPPQATPAVVNPVFRSKMRPYLSLDGPWEFLQDIQQTGLKDKWFSGEFPGALTSSVRTVNVPGTWEANGIGKPGLSHATGREFARILLRNEYVGWGWYRKSFKAPSAFDGKRVWLKIGGVNSLGLFWVNGHYLGTLHTYTSAAYKYEITSLLKPGQDAVVVALVNNQENSRKGNENWLCQFGGLYRSVEVEATPDIWIDDVWAKPDFDHKSVILPVRLFSPWTKDATGTFSIEANVTSLEDGRSAGSGKASLKRVDYTGSTAPIRISLDPFRPWSPAHPSLYKAEITLFEDGKPVDEWIERFGVRKLERSGHDILLNGKKHLMRGFGDDYIYPLTISSPASLDYHKKHLALAHSYGFTFVRHHTHAENPEYYQAADEVGIMIQAGLPYEGIRPSPPGSYQPLDDLNELIHQYRRHVSLSVYSMGNEGIHAQQYRRPLFQYAKAMDPSRLVMHQDGGENYEGISDLKGGPVNVPVTEAAVAGTMPVILHEYLNLCGPADPRLEPSYTGAEAPPYSLEKSRQQAEALGISWDLVVRAIEGGHELQSIYQKIGLENGRSVPGVNGYDYWTIADVLALMPQGLLDPFWTPKRSQPDYFLKFNSDVACLLPDLSPYGLDRTLTSGDRVSHSLACSNYSEQEMDGGATWQLAGATETYAHGSVEGGRVPQGSVTTLGRIEFSMPRVEHPEKLTLKVTMGPGGAQNEWSFYCFPKTWRHANAARTWATDSLRQVLAQGYPGIKVLRGKDRRRHFGSNDTLVTTRLDNTALGALESGGRVLLLGMTDLSPEKVGARLGWWSPINNQRGTALAESEAFGDFPNTGGLPNFSLFRLLHQAVSLEDDLKSQIDPLSITLGSGEYVVPPIKNGPWVGQVDVGASQKTKYLANVFQTKVGSGRLFVSGLKLTGEEPEARYLLDMFLKYVQSPGFEPKASIGLGDLKKVISLQASKKAGA